jgi:hypothetical protein
MKPFFRSKDAMRPELPLVADMARLSRCMN